jgi:hypothetical protein
MSVIPFTVASFVPLVAVIVFATSSAVCVIGAVVGIFIPPFALIFASPAVDKFLFLNPFEVKPNFSATLPATLSVMIKELYRQQVQCL